MKRFVSILLAVLFCCSVFAAGTAGADVQHVTENLYAQSDYVVLSPEYSSAKDTWELWALAYKTGSGNTTGLNDESLDQCVSASLINLGNPALAAGTISTYLGVQYELEDMMAIAGIRYYMFYDFGKKCYLASPGTGLTEVSPIQGIEISDTLESKRILIESDGVNPAFQVLCQLWLYSATFSQIPSAVVKTFGMDTTQDQPLYSKNASDYCSNQGKLQEYCDTLIPVVDSVGSGDTDKPHFLTDIYYRKGATELNVSPSTHGLFVSLDLTSR